MNQQAPRAAEKSQLRRQFRELRLAALADSEALILAAAQREIPILLPAGQRLGIYWPLAGEVDLRPLAALDLPLALPAVWGEAPQPPRLLYRPWHPGEPLAPDHCGIPAPLASDAPTPPATELHPDALGLLLVPALAMDRRGIRLGYGGGWYDRLRAEPAWRAVPALLVLPAACVVEALPRDGWDVPFAGWLDERGLHRIAAANIASL
jgi:5-formyltetrahydrofolate cyclo-ligase